MPASRNGLLSIQDDQQGGGLLGSVNPLLQATMNPNDMGYFPPGTARVAEPTMYDVSPEYVGQGAASTPILSNAEQQWLDIYNALLRSGASQAVIDYHMTQHPAAALAQRIEQGKRQAPTDANVIMQAIEARQRQARK